MGNNEVINVFWTGGMDSTFNLIRRLTTTSGKIQPHYIVRHEDSTGTEIETMISIRRAIVKRFPDVKNRLLPTIYFNEDFIESNKEIDDEFTELRKTFKISEQYQIISRYCSQFKLDRIDLSYEKDLHAAPTGRNLADLFGETTVFKAIVNPLEEITKVDCYKLAKKEGWNDILDLTVFCRRPSKKVKPCGVCGTCIDTVKNGMGFRLPLYNRVKAKILIPFREYWRNNYPRKKDTKIFRIVKEKFESKW